MVPRNSSLGPGSLKSGSVSIQFNCLLPNSNTASQSSQAPPAGLPGSCISAVLCKQLTINICRRMVKKKNAYLIFNHDVLVTFNLRYAGYTHSAGNYDVVRPILDEMQRPQIIRIILSRSVI